MTVLEKGLRESEQLKKNGFLVIPFPRELARVMLEHVNGYVQERTPSKGANLTKQVEAFSDDEFNKVFDDANNQVRRYDEEPAKPLILAASKSPENVSNSHSEEKINKEIKETKSLNIERNISNSDEDSLTVAQKEMELKTQTYKNSSDVARMMSEKKMMPETTSEARNIRKDTSHQEEMKEEFENSGRILSNSKKSVKDKAKNLKKVQQTYSDDEYEEDQYQTKGYNNQVAALAKSKKMKKFVVNTRHCRQERETVQYVIDLCRWYETTAIGEGNLIWYGVSLRDCDIDIIRSRPKIYFNRYPGSELLARK